MPDDLVALSDRPCPGEFGQSGVRCVERTAGEVSTRDPAAGFSRKGRRSFFGTKAHLAVDQGSDLIRKAILISAEIGESIAADALICGDETAALADKAYESSSRREALAGIIDRIMRRRHQAKRTPARQEVDERGDRAATWPDP